MSVPPSTSAPAGRLPGRRLRPIAITALAVCLALAGCGPTDDSGGPGSATAGLLLLAGGPDVARLTAHDPVGQPRDVPLPDPSTAWVSAGRRGTLLVTLDDGGLRVSDGVRSDTDPRWSRVPRPAIGDEPGRLTFATWAPNGLRAAAIEAGEPDPPAFNLVIVDPVGGEVVPWRVERDALQAPPTWVGDEHVLVQTTGGLALVDAGNGQVAAGPPIELGLGVALAVAADGSRVAVSNEAGAVEIRTLDTWLAGEIDGRPDALIEQEGEVGSVALDRRGERLAIVWQLPDRPGYVTIHTAEAGWREVERRTLPGESARVVVDWLP